jgi:hypothetical protein
LWTAGGEYSFADNLYRRWEWEAEHADYVHNAWDYNSRQYVLLFWDRVSRQLDPIVIDDD